MTIDGVAELTTELKHTRHRVREYENIVTRDAAKRLQWYIQKEIDTYHTKGKKNLRKINRGGIHKR